MNIFQVESSFLETIEYEPGTERLTVYFKNRKAYKYEEVSQILFNEFAQAESAGKFFTEKIKPGRHFQELTDNKWVVSGVALEDIKAGEQLEYNPETNRARKLRLPEVG